MQKCEFNSTEITLLYGYCGKLLLHDNESRYVPTKDYFKKITNF